MRLVIDTCVVTALSWLAAVSVAAFWLHRTLRIARRPERA